MIVIFAEGADKIPLLILGFTPTDFANLSAGKQVYIPADASEGQIPLAISMFACSTEGDLRADIAKLASQASSVGAVMGNNEESRRSLADLIDSAVANKAEGGNAG